MTTEPTEPGSAPPGEHATRTHRILRSPITVVAAVLALILGVGLGVLIGRASSGSPVADSVADSAAGSPPAMCQATTVAIAGLPSVVTVSAQASAGGAGGSGSGEIIRAGGYILTNDHVISTAANGGSVAVRYTDGRSSPAAIVGRDVLTDLAVLKADDGANNLPVITASSSRDLVVGEPVVALGAPVGPGRHGDHRHRQRHGP
jgi:putative serine protease PepD